MLVWLLNAVRMRLSPPAGPRSSAVPIQLTRTMIRDDNRHPHRVQQPDEHPLPSECLLITIGKLQDPFQPVKVLPGHIGRVRLQQLLPPLGKRGFCPRTSSPGIPVSMYP